MILYALGVGATTKDLDLVYEGAENFGAITSFGVIPAMGGLSGLISGMVPGLDIDLSKVIFHFSNSKAPLLLRTRLKINLSV